MAELQFAGTTIQIDEVDIAIVTSYRNALAIDEVEVTGASDTMGDAPNQISNRRFVPVGVGETVQLEGITVADDAGQLAIETAARTGKRDVVLRYTAQDGRGAEQTGFFTSFEKGGQVNGMWTFTAGFRVNASTPVEPAP